MSGHLDEYEQLLAGYLVLIAAAVIAPLLARRREVTFAGIAAVLSVIIYVNAPYTGAGDLESLARPFLTALRYLLPAAAAAGFCVVLAASRGKQPGRSFAEAALVLAVAWNLWRTVDLDYPLAPSASTLLIAAALGAFAAWFAPARLVRWAPVAGLLAFVVAGAVATDGYTARHADAGSPRVPFSPVVDILADRSDFEDGSDRVSMAPGVSAMLAGDTLEHEVVLIPSDEPCSKVEARARDGWVVIADVVADSVPAYTARAVLRWKSALDRDRGLPRLSRLILRAPPGDPYRPRDRAHRRALQPTLDGQHRTDEPRRKGRMQELEWLGQLDHEPGGLQEPRRADPPERLSRARSRDGGERPIRCGARPIPGDSPCSAPRTRSAPGTQERKAVPQGELHVEVV